MYRANLKKFSTSECVSIIKYIMHTGPSVERYMRWHDKIPDWVIMTVPKRVELITQVMTNLDESQHLQVLGMVYSVAKHVYLPLTFWF